MRGRQVLRLPEVPWTGLHRYVPIEIKMQLFEILGYDPHEAQMLFHSSPKRFRTYCCGRRFGKTTSGAAELMAYGMIGGKTWGVAPTYDLIGRTFNETMKIINSRAQVRELLAGAPNEAKGSQSVRFSSGGFIEFKSSFKPNSLVGEGLDHIHFDEAALEDDPEIVSQYLRPTLIDRQGSMSAGSTPRGDNWFKTWFERGQDPDSKLSESWKFPTRSNPLISESEIQQLITEEDMTEAVILQEIEAEFIDALGSVFKNYGRTLVIDEPCVYDPAIDGIPCLGADLAKHEDFTVLWVMGSRSGRLLEVQRFKETDWPIQVERICKLAKKWGAPILIEANGVGDPIVDYVKYEMPDGWPIDGYVTSPLSKNFIIKQINRAIQAQEVKLFTRNVTWVDFDGKIIQIGKVIASELGSFRYERTDSGVLRMTAPPGKHDDCVMAFALSYQCCLQYGGPIDQHGSTTVAEDPVRSKPPTVSQPTQPEAVGGKKFNVPQMGRRRRR